MTCVQWPDAASQSGSKKSGGLVVAASRFDALLAGSAVSLTGGARAGGVGVGARVVGNTARALGALLPSVAGVLCSACADAVIANNTIARGARWGVHVRSGPGPWDHRDPGGAAADATGVVVDGNVLVALGARSDDCDAVSVISYRGAPPQARGVIARNCVVGVGRDGGADATSRAAGAVGADATESGGERRELAIGIYLDNYASGWRVEVRGSERGPSARGGGPRASRNALSERARAFPFASP